MSKKKILGVSVILLLVVAIILVCTLTAHATDYYFSSTGSDGNTGTSSASPWQTIGKANTLLSSTGAIQPGDRVLFKGGDTWYGSISIGKSGTSTSPIIITRYGTGLPTITGLITITGWGAVSGGIAESAAFTALPSSLKIVLINGQLYSIGRWPDQSNWKVGVYRPINSESIGTCGGQTNKPTHAWVVDNSLPSTPDWDGATAVFHSSRWTIDNALITSHVGTTLNINFDIDNCYPLTDNGYFIQNHPSTLSKFGEWYHNPTPDKIKIYFGGTSPASVTVQASTFQNLVTSSSKSYITFDGITFKGANENCFNISNGTNWVIKNCEIQYTGQNGINGSATSNILIDNNDIIYSYNDAIRIAGCLNATTTNNFINYTYFAAGMGVSGNSQGNGIRNGANSLVQYNSILNSGFLGISVGTSKVSGQSSRILNNFIDTMCFVKDDGGGIYDYVGHGDPGGTDYYVNYSQKIIGNIVINMLGAGEGVRGSTTYLPSVGIYTDDGSNHCEITGNVIGNGVGWGLLLHNTTSSTVTSNTIYNIGMSAAIYKHDGLGWAVQDITTTSNVFFAKTSSQYTAQYIGATMSDMRWFTNYYARPVSETGLHIKLNTTNYNLTGWKATSTHPDAGSTISWPSPITTGTETRLEYNATQQNKVIPLSGTYKDIQGNTFVGSVTLVPYSGKVLIKTSTTGGNVPPSVSVTSPANGASFAAPATVSITATASDPDGTVSSVAFYNGNTLLSTDNTSPYAFSWTSVAAGNYSISARATDNSGAVTASTAVNITVTGGANQSPSVSITSPSNNATFTAPASIAFIATASDPDGTVSKVEFYNGSTLIQTESNAPYEFTWNNVPQGTYFITAKAYDNSSAVTTSSAITLVVSDPTNQSPTVSITGPTGGTVYTAPASVIINATAADADGTVASVSFYNGGTLLNTDNTAPFTYTWTGVPTGNYSLSARATDNDGAVTISTSIAISVITGNAAPTVSITTPSNGASFTSPASVFILASASDPDGTITKVEFYEGTTLFHTETAAPYEFTWSNVPPGNYTISGIATDNSGAASSASVISITVNNTAPTVSITSPASGASFVAPATVVINATASDANGTITGVSFYSGGTLLGTDNLTPFTFTWNSVPTGNYSLTAIATDNNGSTTTSTAIPITVTSANIAPTVSISSPANGASYTSPASVVINATASDADGTVASVAFYNGTTLLNTDVASPFTYTWTSVPVGSYSLVAKATDNIGAVSSSAPIGITVSNTPPTVSITSPANNATYTEPATVIINATASDANGTVSSVSFYNGGVLLGTDASSPYTYTWNSVATGNYSLQARATDNEGTVTSSSSISISVASANLPPTVSVTAPANNATYTSPASIVINVTASDPDGTVASVGFYNGTTLLNTDNASPFTFTWSGVAPGSYFVSAKATDNGGLISTSSAISVTVSNTPPTVTITAPANNASYFTPATINMAATAADPNGTITSVGFYNGGTLVGTDNTSPYTLSFSIPTAGTYQLTANATDNEGAVTTSSTITVTVADPVTVFPTVSITSPLFNATYTAPATIVINADASDADGTISSVAFYNGATLLNTDLASPYTYTWNSVGIGSYSLTARATDNNGNVTTSTAISITVTNALPVVNITSPTNNSSFLPSSIISFVATATDANGTITNVKFYDGATLMQTETSAPYEFTRGGFAAGSSHTITAVATDNNGGVTTSTPVTFNISTNPTPTVTVIAPTEGQVFTSHNNITLTATATDDGTIASVKFYDGVTLLNTDNTSPYTFSWTNVSSGTKSIRAEATDNLGAIGTSTIVNILVQNILPTVSITSPADGASFVAPATIPITVTATDANGTITKVDFYNGGVLIGTDNTSPYTFNWTSVPTGSYILTAKATDNDGDVTTSAAKTVTSTNTPPTVSLSATVISANPWNIYLLATATDANGSITKVDFFEGATLLTIGDLVETTAPYEFTVIPAGAGTFSFTATTTDNDGATTTSNTVTLTLAAPTVSITSVTVTDNITPGIVDIAATATDNVSVAKVDFYANDVLIGTDLSSPYTFSWTNVVDGVYVIHAVATDNDGATTQTPDEAPIEILTNTVGNVSITNLFQTYDGTPKPVDVTIPGNYPYDIFYSDDPNPPTDAGTYTVVVTINDGIHFGTATETLVIAKADPGAVWPQPASITYLTPLSATQFDSATADVPGTWVFTPPISTVLGAGTQTLQGIFTPTDLTNYKLDTVLTNIIVNKATAVLAITSESSFVYDGQPKVATATVTPNVGNIIITYNGSLTPPKEKGVYTILVTLEDDNYAAETVSGTLEITQVTPTPTETRNFLLLNRSTIVNKP